MQCKVCLAQAPPDRVQWSPADDFTRQARAERGRRRHVNCAARHAAPCLPVRQAWAAPFSYYLCAEGTGTVTGRCCIAHRPNAENSPTPMENFVANAYVYVTDHSQRSTPRRPETTRCEMSEPGPHPRERPAWPAPSDRACIAASLPLMRVEIPDPATVRKAPESRAPPEWVVARILNLHEIQILYSGRTG